MCCFFNDNRDNADNGLSATCTELGCRGKFFGFMDCVERGISDWIVKKLFPIRFG